MSSCRFEHFNYRTRWLTHYRVTMVAGDMGLLNSGFTIGDGVTEFKVFLQLKGGWSNGYVVRQLQKVEVLP